MFMQGGTVLGGAGSYLTTHADQAFAFKSNSLLFQQVYTCGVPGVGSAVSPPPTPTPPPPQ